MQSTRVRIRWISYEIIMNTVQRIWRRAVAMVLQDQQNEGRISDHAVLSQCQIARSYKIWM